jgi:hypothetical protein
VLLRSLFSPESASRGHGSFGPGEFADGTQPAFHGRIIIDQSKTGALPDERSEA